MILHQPHESITFLSAKYRYSIVEWIEWVRISLLDSIRRITAPTNRLPAHTEVNMQFGVWIPLRFSHDIGTTVGWMNKVGHCVASR